MATGALLVHQPSIGCVRSTRTYAKRAARGVIASVSSLIECFLDQTAYISHKQIGAQKTGAVWSACDSVQKVPKGNRSAMRRDLLTWAMECNETMQEFEQLVQQSTDDSKQEDTEDENDVASWEDFCGGAGTGETYRRSELPVVNACLGLIKCSRGTINAVLQTCESGGDQASNIGNMEEERAAYLWINKLHDSCRNVGENMTDLGSLLYPPLQIESQEHNSQQEANGNIVDDDAFWNSFGELGTQILHQQRFISTTLQMILNGPNIIQLSQELVDFVNKLMTASQKRFDDAKVAISQVETST